MDFIFLTYAEYLSYCSASVLGSLLGIGIIGAIIYLLFKAFIFLLPFIMIMVIGSLIVCVSRHGVKKFFLGLKYLFLGLLISAIIFCVFIGLAALCANNDHPVFAILLSIPGFIGTVYVIILSIGLFIHCIRNSEIDKDKKFPFYMIGCFMLYLLLVLIDAKTMLPSYIGPISLISIIVLVYIVIVNLKRKYEIGKSLLLGFVPIIAVFTVTAFYDITKSIQILTVKQYIQIVAYNLIIYEVPSLLIAMINKKRLKREVNYD